MNISARALGVLCYLAYTGAPATVEHLQTVFNEGRDALRAAARELEAMGFLVRKNTKVGNRYIRESRLTDEAYLYLDAAGFQRDNSDIPRVSSLLSQLSEQNNHILLNNLNSKESTREAREEYKIMMIGESMPYEFFEKTSSDVDDIAKQRQKAIQYKKEQYQKAKNERAAKSITKRDDLPQESWSCSDVAYEFAYRLSDKWHIPQMEVMRTRFVPALANMRSKFDTDGRVEIIMMDMFFESIDFQKYNDANVLWKMFVKRIPEYVQQAKSRVTTPEQLEEAQVAADKSWDWMED